MNDESHVLNQIGTESIKDDMLRKTRVAIRGRLGCYQKVVGPLCARDYKGVGNEYVMEDKVVCYPIRQI